MCEKLSLYYICIVERVRDVSQFSAAISANSTRSCEDHMTSEAPPT